MLRFAFTRAPRVVLPSPSSRTAWLRLVSTGTKPPQSGASTSELINDTLDDSDILTSPERPDSLTADLTVRSTTAELFGARSPPQKTGRESDANVNLKLIDPKRLPLTEPLGENFTEAEFAATLIHGRGFQRPFHHPRTHDIPVANIQFRSHHPELLDLFTHFAAHAASALGIPVSRVVTLPTKRSLWTVIRSPHIFKKSQENFERKVHKRAIKAWDADPEVVDRWCQYLRRHALGGVGMRVTKWRRAPLGIGAAQLAEVEESLKVESGSQTDAEKIKALGKKIVREEMASLAGGKVVEEKPVSA